MTNFINPPRKEELERKMTSTKLWKLKVDHLQVPDLAGQRRQKPKQTMGEAQEYGFAN